MKWLFRLCFGSIPDHRRTDRCNAKDLAVIRCLADSVEAREGAIAREMGAKDTRFPTLDRICPRAW